MIIYKPNERTRKIIKEKLVSKKLFLLDMDGTIYLDDNLFESVNNFFRKIREIGGKYVFLTNNSSKNVFDYIKKLRNFGIIVDESNFFTSSQATALYLSSKYKDTKKKIYVLGTNSLKKELSSYSLNVVDKLSNDIDCLIVGFDTELTYQKLVDACKILFESKEIEYLATNPDLVCPTSFGFIPDCGSICKILEITTGKTPLFIGKPNSIMIEYVIEKTGFTKDETIVIGDRLYTDIASGLNAGVTTALVLTGETELEDLKNTRYIPDLVFNHIKEIYSVIFER